MRLKKIYKAVLTGWQWMTKPSDALVDAEQRRRAKLLLTLITAILLLGVPSTAVRILTDPNYELPIVVIVGWVLFFVLYFVARTIYFTFSGYAVTYLIAYVNLSQPYFNSNTTLFPDGLAYATVSLVLSSLFTTKRNTIILSFLIVAAIGFLPIFVEDIQPRDVESPIIFFTITSLLLILNIHHRDNVEKDRQAKLTASEQLYRTLYQEKTALLSASNIISSSLDIEEVLEKIAQTMVDVTGVNSCTIAQWNKETNVVKVRVVWPEQAGETNHYLLNELYKNHPRLKTVLETAQPLTLNNQLKSLFPQKGVEAENKPQDLLILPLYIGDFVAGLVELRSEEGKVVFDEKSVEFCLGLAAQASIALDHAQLYFQVAQYSEILEENVAERTQALKVANEQLLHLSRLKDEFVSNVSHELRTPITNIMLYNNLIAANPDKRVTYDEVIRREINRLSSLIEGLLRLSRLDQGREEFNPILFDVNQLAEVYVQDRQLLARDRSLTLTFNCQSDLPQVKGDRGLIGQVLSILLTNAINYTQPGGAITVQTAVSHNESGDLVEITVLDTGVGIPAEEHPNLFERFFRGGFALKSRISGTGLGLAIAREIVHLHQGEIKVVSQGVPGQGSKFIVRLPVHPPKN